MDHMTRVSSLMFLTGPLQHVLYGLCSSRHQPALVSVLQSQDKRASVLLGKDVIIESSSEASEV